MLVSSWLSKFCVRCIESNLSRCVYEGLALVVLGMK